MAEGDLSAPLLPQKRVTTEQPIDHHHVTVTIDTNAGLQAQIPTFNGNHQPRQISFTSDRDLQSGRAECPYGFLGAGQFSVPTSTSIDPFRNHTPEIDGVYEWLKIVLCLPIALIRIALFVLTLGIGYLATKIALQGWKDKQNPMPRWRCRIMWITRICARCILFAFGYQWIKRKGRPAPREMAPIVVSNHVSYIDPIFFFYELCPTIVSSDSHDSLPFVGTIIRAMQVIYVNRFSSPSRKNAVNEIKRKASCDQYPRVLLFPEGTTTNGRALLSFQLGAFIPGYPIQPVVVRYPHVHFDQSWGNISLGKLMFRMFTQFHNFMEVEYLPVISPTENQRDVFSFAERTGHAMTTALNVVQTSHSYGDSILLTKAAEAKQENPSCYMVEMDKAYHINTPEAMEFLDKFLTMKPDKSGHVNLFNFAMVMKLKVSSVSEKIFTFLDVERRGKITFKEFLYGSIHVLKHRMFKRACELTFSKCNISGDHFISKIEFGDSVRLSIPDMSDDEVSDLFNAFDTDGDGKVSHNDLFAYLRKNPLMLAIFSPLLQSNLLENIHQPTRQTV
ncbi:hypothetical protein V2J09_018297 [Rumex salicifolius]